MTIAPHPQPMAALLVADPYAVHVAARLLDFFADAAPWSRRLWDISSVLALREAHELGRWQAQSVISAGAVTWYLRALERQLGPDRGLGESKLRKLLTTLLRSGLEPDSPQRRQLAQLLPMIETGYLDRWYDAGPHNSVAAETLPLTAGLPRRDGRHTTVTWAGRQIGYALARAYAGTPGRGDAGTTSTPARRHVQGRPGTRRDHRRYANHVQRVMLQLWMQNGYSEPMGTSTIGFSITDEDRARLDRLAERLSGGNRSAFLRASLSVMESIERANRLRDLAVIAEEHAAERGVTDDNFLDAIKTSYKQR